MRETQRRWHGCGCAAIQCEKVPLALVLIQRAAVTYTCGSQFVVCAGWLAMTSNHALCTPPRCARPPTHMHMRCGRWRHKRRCWWRPLLASASAAVVVAQTTARLAAAGTH